MIKEVELMKRGIYKCKFDKNVISYEILTNLVHKFVTQYWSFTDLFESLKKNQNNFVHNNFTIIQNIRKQIIDYLIRRFLNCNFMDDMFDLYNSIVEIYINETSLVNPLLDDQNYRYADYLNHIRNRNYVNASDCLYDTIYCMFIPEIVSYCFPPLKIDLCDLFTSKVCALDITQDDKKHFRLLQYGVFTFDKEKNYGLFESLDFLDLNKPLADIVLEHNFYLDESIINVNNRYKLFHCATIDHGIINL